MVSPPKGARVKEAKAILGSNDKRVTSLVNFFLC
jgi:hypothetical protein